LLLLCIQYPLSGFLLESPGARNWFFGGDTWYYAFSATAPYRHRFNPAAVASPRALVKGVGVAIVIGMLVARVSLRWGRWLQNIQR